MPHLSTQPSCAATTTSCSAAHPASANRTQETTPIGITLSPDETVTVIDPRHALYGRTLPLLGITTKQYQGRCCVVWVHEGIEQLVPLAATDRAPEPPTLSPVPLALGAVQQLLTTWQRILARPGEDVDDGHSRHHEQSPQGAATSGAAGKPRAGVAGTSLEAADTAATTAGAAGRDPGRAQPGAVRGGGETP